jgi:hypothetical protein
MRKIRYIRVFPKKFGTMLVAPGPPTAKIGDWELGVLETLREHFWEKEGDVLSWKQELAPLADKIDGLHTGLERLWKAGLIFKFASSFHTQSGRPQYIKWYIWEEK